MATWTAPLTWTGVPTATQFNQQIRDNPQVLLGPMDSAGWQKWLPAARFAPGVGAPTLAVQGSEGAAARMPAYVLAATSDTTVVTTLWVPVAGFPIVEIYTAMAAGGDTGQQDFWTRFTKLDGGDQVDEVWDFDTFNGLSASNTGDELTVTRIHNASNSLYVTPGLYRVGFRRNGVGAGDTAIQLTNFIGMHIRVNLE